MEEFNHTTVLLNEAIDGLSIKPDGVYVDCTLGGAGHSSVILGKLNDNGHLFAFDQDETAIENAKVTLKDEINQGKVTLIHRNFQEIEKELHKRGINKVDGILYDLGVSSPQLDEAERGFSYHQDAKLDMRMDQTAQLSAYELVNEWDYNSLVSIFYKYGEEKFSKQIARKIESHRENKPIETTGELVEIIKEGIPAPARRKGGHPAKRIFQAIRIAVNDELGVLERSLDSAIRLIKVGGRISVITFHSLEDRIVKHTFKELSTMPDLPKGLPVIPEGFEPMLKQVNRKPITANDDELEENNRSRSAKLRIAEKLREDETQE